MKLTILWCGEAHYLSTGYATYSLEILKRLHATGKYDLYELATYGHNDDPRAQNCPWQFIGVLPQKGEEKQYNGNSLDQFGTWKFEKTCLNVRPHAVCDVRDTWMCSYQANSPFRPYYHWTWMSPVDGIPQAPDWLEMAMAADAVFTYSDWGDSVLRKEGGGRIKLRGSVPPGADFDTYQMRDRRAQRRMMGLDSEIFLVGTVMRNQTRKLFPALGEAFAQFLREAPQEIAEKTCCLWHTAHPDIGYDIPRILKDNGIASRVYFVYTCRKCGLVFPSLFQDAATGCLRCKGTATLPNTQHGVSRKILADIYSLFDVYVQYSASEGLGMPSVEAAACGISVMEVDYSAMEDVVRKLKGIPLAVKGYYVDVHTGRRFAVPDNDDLVKKLIDFLLLPESIRLRMGRDTRRAAETYYNWDKTAKIWEDHFDAIPISNKWISPAYQFSPSFKIPVNLSNEQFVKWGLINIAGRPDLVNSFQSFQLLRDLNWGSTTSRASRFNPFSDQSLAGNQTKAKPFTRDDAIRQFLEMCEYRNKWEGLRSEGSMC